MMMVEAQHPYAIASILILVVVTPRIAGRVTYAPYLPDGQLDRERLVKVRAAASNVCKGKVGSGGLRARAWPPEQTSHAAAASGCTQSGHPC